MLSHALTVQEKEQTLVERNFSPCKVVRQLLVIVPHHGKRELIPVTGAVAGQHRHPALFLLAAIGGCLGVMPFLKLLYPAATGVVCPPLRRAAAYFAVTGAFPGERLGDSRGASGKGQRGADDRHPVDHRQQQGNGVAGPLIHEDIESDKAGNS